MIDLQTYQKPDTEPLDIDAAGPTTLISHLNDPNNEAIHDDASMHKQ